MSLLPVVDNRALNANQIVPASPTQYSPCGNFGSYLFGRVQPILDCISSLVYAVASVANYIWSDFCNIGLCLIGRVHSFDHACFLLQRAGVYVAIAWACFSALNGNLLDTACYIGGAIGLYCFSPTYVEIPLSFSQTESDVFTLAHYRTSSGQARTFHSQNNPAFIAADDIRIRTQQHSLTISAADIQGEFPQIVELSRALTGPDQPTAPAVNAIVVREQRPDTTGWNGLPRDVGLEIFSLLGLNDIAAAGRTCRSWRVMARNDRLWRHFFNLRFHSPSHPLPDGTCLESYQRHHLFSQNLSHDRFTSRVVNGAQQGVCPMAFVDGRLITCRDSNMAKIWDLATNRWPNP